MVETKEKIKTRTNIRIRKKYNCIYYNDDYTDFEFVKNTLVNIFNNSENDALLITMRIHHIGFGVANKKPLSKDIAETKRDEVLKIARENGYPLVVKVEEVELGGLE